MPTQGQCWASRCSAPTGMHLISPPHVGSISAASSDDREAVVSAVAVKQGRPAGGEMRLAFMAGELIYANVRLRLRLIEPTRSYFLESEPAQ
jgi:hypothetical protein